MNDQVIVTTNPTAVPVSPQDALTRVSPADIANLVRVRQLDRLNALLAEVGAAIATETGKADAIANAHYQDISAKVVAMVNDHPLMRAVGVTVSAQRVQVRCCQPFTDSGGVVRMYWTSDALRHNHVNTTWLIQPQEWYFPNGTIGTHAPHKVKHDGYARFVVGFGNRHDGCFDTDQHPKTVDCSGGELIIRIPSAMMPAWNLDLSAIISEVERLSSEHKQIAAAIQTLTQPGRIEALMTAHVLEAAGIDLSGLESKIRAAIEVNNG
jgi:hypothetical protein